MTHSVAISFGPNQEYEYKLSAIEVGALSRDAAHDWLQREFDTLQCEPRNPLGKILLLDVILEVARYRGDEAFATHGDWAKQFARCCAAATGRQSIRVDVLNLAIG